MAAGKKLATVPWSTLTLAHKDYIDSDFLPEGFEFKDPSKLSFSAAQQLLSFWAQRQQDDDEDHVFQFKAIRGASGTAVATRYEIYEPGNTLPTVTKRGRGKPRSVPDSEDGTVPPRPKKARRATGVSGGAAGVLGGAKGVSGRAEGVLGGAAGVSGGATAAGPPMAGRPAKVRGDKEAISSEDDFGV